MDSPTLPARNQVVKALKDATAALKRGGAHVARAPWKRIGPWAGGAFAVVVIIFALVVTFADWNTLRGPIGRMASAATGREIVIAGDLKVRPWSLTPELSVTNLRIGNPSRYRDRGEFANVAQANFAVRLLPLLIGHFDIVRLDLNGADVSLYRSPSGDGNWNGDPNPNARAFDMPAIQHFALHGGRLSFVDEKRRMALNGGFTSEESLQGSDPGRFTLNGEGTLNSKPFSVALTGAALIHVQRDHPYAFSADVHAGATHVVAYGAITKPFDFSNWSADVRGTGDDLADLYYLIGLTLPNTPPYALSGRVARNGARYEMTQIAGRVGDSDLAGHFVVTHDQGRPFLIGDFRSHSLDWDDMMAVLGSPPAPAKPASFEQRQTAARFAATGRILPDARLDIHRVRNMDARVNYIADHIRSNTLPLRAGRADIALDHGLLRLDPMNITLARGHVAGAVSINARQDVPQVDLDARLTGARLEDFLALHGQPAMTGTLLGRVRLSGRGAAVREAAANANGQVSFVVPHGDVRAAFAELTGINVTRGLGLLLTHDQSTIGIRCGVAHMNVRNGIATADNITFDTDTMLIHGGGRVSLRDETFDLQIRGEPKEPRLIRVAAPIELHGHLRDPHVSVNVGRAAGQAGLAAVLSTLVTPIASILPFVDIGLADDADCNALLASVQPAPHARAG